MLPTSEYEYNLIRQEQTGPLAPDVTRSEYDETMEALERAEEEQLERLEETDPSTDDGRWGGDYCVHHHYIGTPGGADFMCGLCEDGATFWVDDPAYELVVTVNDAEFRPGNYYWTSAFTSPRRGDLRRFAALRREMRSVSVIAQDTTIPVSFRMEEFKAGRWEDPSVTFKTDVEGLFGNLEAEELERAFAVVYNIPADAVYVGDFEKVETRGLSIVYVGVTGAIDRRHLSELQLERIEGLVR